jgi:enoyl-CoA hydratase/carnithine racemase
MVEPTEAVDIGLADWQGETDQLHTYLGLILEEIRQNSRVAVREMKKILGTGEYNGPEEAATIEAAASRRCLAEGDAVERVQRFLRAKSKSRTGGTTAAPVDDT